MDMKRFLVMLFVTAQFIHSSCATSPYLKGVTPDGQKVYLGPTPIENTEALETFLQSSRTEATKLDYLIERLKLAENLEFFHGRERFEWKEALEAAKWLVAHHYKKGQDARAFIRKEAFLYVCRAWKTERRQVSGRNHSSGLLHPGQRTRLARRNPTAPLPWHLSLGLFLFVSQGGAEGIATLGT